MQDPDASVPAHDVIVAGAGIGGICAAIGAARAGARVLLLEASPEIGGTGVHSPVGLVCKFRDAAGRPINTGLHRELFPRVYDLAPEDVPTYDETDLRARYAQLIAAEPLIKCITGAPVVEAARDGDRIVSVTTGGRHPAGWRARVFIDSTFNANLSVLAGARFQLGRQADGFIQPVTLTFKVTGIDWSARPGLDILKWRGNGWLKGELSSLYKAARAADPDAAAGNLRNDVLFFPYPDGQSLLFNSTRLLGFDPDDAQSVAAARAAGERQVHALFAIIRQHPCLRDARVAFISQRLGQREGRRVIGDYILTREDCLGEARFADMVAACSYEIDIHDPVTGGATLISIPGSGYYHIPYRCLRAKGLGNLLLGSRCISGTHEAHASYRVMSCLSAVGQAAGVAAALAATRHGGETRAVPPAAIRAELHRQGAFVD